MSPKLTLCLVGAASLLPLTALANIERHVVRTFDVQPGVTVRIETEGGGITVQPAAENVVKIDVRQRISASSDAEADELLKNLDLTFEQKGTTVTSVAKYHGPKLTSWLRHSWPPVQCEYVITVPASCNVHLNTSGGGIEVGDLTGRIETRSSGGGLRFGHITGDINGQTSGGGIDIAACNGNVEVETSGGGIHTGPVTGRARLETSGGGIHVSDVSGNVQAHTSGGPIDVSIAGAVTADSVFDTSGGGITLRVDRQARFNLDAHTSGGSVRCDLPVTVQGKMGDGKLVGPVNGGGPTISLHTSGGGITVHAR